MSQVAHIYKITNPSTGQIYIGSTYKNPEVRFQSHKYHYNNYINGNSNKQLSAFKLFENNCMNICYVSTIESLVVNSIYELRDTEAKHILEAKRFELKLVNKNIPNRTLSQYYLDNKQKYKNYYESNKTRILDYQKNYNNTNRDSIKQYHKQYYIQNKTNNST
tara:strand:- start:14160 stop:14648 length:489 start_codon:yes stop_codon:yes gene_type:complete